MTVSSSADDFLRLADDVLDDWQGSLDSATWNADGSHQPEILNGDYYRDDELRPRYQRSFYEPLVPRQQPEEVTHALLISGRDRCRPMAIQGRYVTMAVLDLSPAFAEESPAFEDVAFHTAQLIVRKICVGDRLFRVLVPNNNPDLIATAISALIDADPRDVALVEVRRP